MRMRHRIPTIFNLSMVDVLCCALGCVILLWLVNLREAKRRAVVAGEITSRLVEAEQRLAASQQEVDRLRSELARAVARAAAINAELDQDKKELTTARSRLADIEDRLARKSEDYQSVLKERALAVKDIDALQMLLRDKEALARAAAQSADDLTDRLRSAEVGARKLRDEVAGLRDKAGGAESRVSALEKELDQRRRDLAAARQSIDDLEGKTRVLSDAVVRARAAADNRFAGIALTGRRVVFLVDMSGSMELVDEKTPAPDKWTGVRETLVKITRSLPQLQKFQVVLFEAKTSYLLGNEGRWIDYDPKTSVEQIGTALAAVKPKGNTNMYAAFETAFRFRADGLDTIYVLSDGLPNVGAGLTAEQARALSEFQRSEILGTHVRKTLKTQWNAPAADKSRVRINTIGFFYESPDVGAFLWALARENDGSFVGMSKP
jgi:predicted  nucleic acid-binding Zn-ribbon protein